jgi:hypothetical protein
MCGRLEQPRVWYVALIGSCLRLTRALVEMKAVREDVEKRIEAKMEAIQSARTEALDALKGVVAETQVGSLSWCLFKSDEAHLVYKVLETEARG